MSVLSANPNAIILQSRLYSPSFIGAGKWVVVEPTTRRAFLAVGKDVVPEAIKILSLGTLDRDSGTEGTEEQIATLLRTGLLNERRDARADDSGSGCSFVEWYHRANFNYPFPDYSDLSWAEKDRALMARYARQSPPPPTQILRNGTIVPLPDVSPTSLVPTAGTGRLSLRGLAAVLRYSLGPIGEIPGGDFGPWLRKTSPSGGARHPTECSVQLWSSLEHVEPGFYFYDTVRHALVRTEGEFPGTWVGEPEDHVGFVLTSRVERPMWRYRDMRALRPTLLDAGHVVEMLSLLLGLQGMGSRCIPSSIAGPETLSGFTEPVVALLLAGPLGSSSGWGPPSTFSRSSEAYTVSGSLTTNPFMYICCTAEGFMGRVVWPRTTEISLALSDFGVLTHCLMSRRRDRDTTIPGILAEVPDMTPSRISALLSAHTLMTEEQAIALYRGGMSLWVQSGWYLSLLAHLEARSAPPAPACQGSVALSVREMITLEPEQLINAMLSRRTTRRFADRPLSATILAGIMREITSSIQPREITRMKVFIALLNIDGIPAGLYELNFDDNTLISRDWELSRHRIVEMTIGQAPAGSGAATVWLLRRLELREPACYEAEIVEMGRIGQRICLASAAAGIGVFLTPAVHDLATYGTFQITEPHEWVTYVFSIGHCGG